jgi:hypothetical protein
MLLTCLALTAACSVAEAPSADSVDAVDSVDSVEKTAPTMPSIEPTEVQVLGGVVHEVLPAAHYTYVRIGAPGTDGDWAVVMGTLDAVTGQAITLSVQGSQHDFHSRRLDRDFERLFFASVPSRA